MEGNELQPYDELTLRELQAISRWLDLHIQDLREKQAEIHSELRHRQRTEPTIDHALPRGIPHRLSYQTRQAVGPREALLRDSYAREARTYGLRIAIAVIAITFLGTLILLAAVAIK
jgi:hypothetical protein